MDRILDRNQCLSVLASLAIATCVGGNASAADRTYQPTREPHGPRCIASAFNHVNCGIVMLSK